MVTTGVLGRPTTRERRSRSTISVLMRRADSGWSAMSWVNAAVESRSRCVSRSDVDGRGARPVGDQRHLADEVAAADLRELGAPSPCRSRRDDPQAARGDEVEAVGGVALADEHGAARHRRRARARRATGPGPPASSVPKTRFSWTSRSSSSRDSVMSPRLIAGGRPPGRRPGPTAARPPGRRAAARPAPGSSRSNVRNMRMPSTATLTSVAATTVALRGAPSRMASSPKYEPGPTRVDLVALAPHHGLALEDHEQRVAGLPLADEVGPGRELGASARGARSSGARASCTGRTGRPPVSSSASSRFEPCHVAPPLRPRRPVGRCPRASCPRRAVAYRRRDGDGTRRRCRRVLRGCRCVGSRCSWSTAVGSVIVAARAVPPDRRHDRRWRRAAADRRRDGGSWFRVGTDRGRRSQHRFANAGQSDFVVLVTARRRRRRRSPTVRAAGLALTTPPRTGAPGIVSASSYWSRQPGPAEERDGHQALSSDP